MENNLRIKNLEISMIKKDFIENDNGYKYDYEDYVLEWINNSKFVTDNQKCLFEKIPHINQSNGEYDLKNKVKEYELKMMVEQKSVEKMAYYSHGIYEETKTGVVFHTASKYNIKENRDEQKEYQVYWGLKIFRGISCSDFVRIDKMKKNELENIYDKIIKSFISKIKKDKNIIYYFPVDIFYPDKETTKEIAIEIINTINKDLNGFIEFRKTKTDKETYICFISKNYVIFARCSSELKLEYYDMVETSSSELFMKIKDISSFWK